MCGCGGKGPIVPGERPLATRGQDVVPYGTRRYAPPVQPASTQAGMVVQPRIILPGGAILLDAIRIERD